MCRNVKYKYYFSICYFNFQPQYIKSLSEILVHVGHSPVARMASGLQLKNLLTSKDLNTKAQHQQRWLMLPEDIRLYVKKNVSLRALRFEKNLVIKDLKCSI